MTTAAYAERVTVPFQAPSGGALLPILDAEVVAINGIPVMPLEQRSEPHWLNPWHNPEPYLMAARILIPPGITGCVVWGAVDLVGAVATHAAGIAVTAEYYLGIAILGLLAAVALLGGGKRCPGLHCAGCR